MKVIQARLGHSSAKTTLDVYGHLFADEGIEAAHLIREKYPHIGVVILSQEDRTRAAIDAAFATPSAPNVHQRDGRPG